MSKRPRHATDGAPTSLTGTETMGSMREKEPRLINAEFIEFRKRHIKQNKEIIATNVTTKLSMAAVQTEVYALRREILEVRQRNLALGREMRKRSQAQVRTPDVTPAQRQAVEAILAAVPALQQLIYDSLIVTPPTPESHPDWSEGLDGVPKSSPPSACLMPLVYTSRPAAIAAATKNKGLGTLVEGSECGSEVDPGDMEERRVRIPAKARNSGISSVSTRPSPSSPTAISAPAATTSPPPQPLPAYIAAVGKSPLLSSPSLRPSPRRKSRGNAGAKKRRESGLLLPIVPPIPAQHARRDDSGGHDQVEAADQRDGEVINVRNEEVERDEDAVQDLIVAEVSVERGGDTSNLAHESVSFDKGKGRARTNTSPADDPPPSEPTSTTSVVSQRQGELVNDSRPARSTSEEAGTDEGDGVNGGRGRRSRNSVVSYKEPSLNKKMRKPGGTGVEDIARAAGGGARSSLISTASASSTVPDQPPPGNLTSSPILGQGEEIPTASSSRRPKSSDTAGPSSVPSAALRRKSVLPRPERRGGTGAAGHPDDGDTDEEAEMREKMQADKPTHPPPRSASGSQPTPQSMLSAPSAHSLSNGDAPHRNRTSPRKSPQKNSPQRKQQAQQNQAAGRATKEETAAALAVKRDPLSDRRDNGQAGKRSLSAGGGSGAIPVGMAPGSGGGGRIAEGRKVSG